MNVSKLGGRLIGAGGFIDITQSAKRVCFCFTFESRNPKFVPAVDHLTFSGSQAIRNRQEVVYVTERAMFALTPDGLCLVEVAAGLDLKADVLDHIPFPVSVSQPLRPMPADIFEPVVHPFRLAPAVR